MAAQTSKSDFDRKLAAHHMVEQDNKELHLRLQLLYFPESSDHDTWVELLKLYKAQKDIFLKARDQKVGLETNEPYTFALNPAYTDADLNYMEQLDTLKRLARRLHSATYVETGPRQFHITRDANGKHIVEKKNT